MSRKIFDYITDGDLKWNRITDPYDQGIFPGQTYDFISGEKEFLEKMCSYFPEERKALVEYLKLIKDAVASSKAFLGQERYHLFSEKLLGISLIINFLNTQIRLFCKFYHDSQAMSAL